MWSVEVYSTPFHFPISQRPIADLREAVASGIWRSCAHTSRAAWINQAKLLRIPRYPTSPSFRPEHNKAER
jgi:hypothetical protein